ncbi:MAG: glycosyltransferase family 39 protein [Pseudomonadota bacterium]
MPILSILALSLALRLIWILSIPVNPVSDSEAYRTLATNIVVHGVYGWAPGEPGAYWAVGPAAIYAAGYFLFGVDSALGIVLPNTLSSLAITWFLFDLGRRWFDPRVGLTAAFLFSIWPLSIQFSTVLASELHFMAFSLAALAAWDRVGFNLGGLFFLLLSGLAFGAATYVRPIALLMPAALALAALIRAPRTSWTDLVKAAVTTALIFALVAPWSARNERVFGDPVFMSTNFWANFWMGNNPETEGTYMPLPEAVKGVSEIERSDYLKKISLTYLEAEPAAFVLRTLWKSLRLHERETIGVAWNEGELKNLVGDLGLTIIKLVSTGYWYLMLAAAFVGIIVLARGALGQPGQGWRVIVDPTVWLWLYFTGVHAVIVVGDRYHMPAIPLIALLAAVAFTQLSRRKTQ